METTFFSETDSETFWVKFCLRGRLQDFSSTNFFQDCFQYHQQIAKVTGTGRDRYQDQNQHQNSDMSMSLGCKKLETGLQLSWGRIYDSGEFIYGCTDDAGVEYKADDGMIQFTFFGLCISSRPLNFSLQNVI